MIDGGNSNKDSPWYTGKLEYPRGRGIHFQLEVDSIATILERLNKHNYPIKEQPKEYAFRKDKKTLRFKRFLVMDLDGYLLMFNEDL